MKISESNRSTLCLLTFLACVFLFIVNNYFTNKSFLDLSYAFVLIYYIVRIAVDEFIVEARNKNNDKTN